MSLLRQAVPFVEGTARVLIGAGRVKQIGKLSEYETAKEQGRAACCGNGLFSIPFGPRAKMDS